jgi:hypothetical protein
LSIALFSISGCSTSGGIKAEDKELLRNFCLSYQNYAYNSYDLGEKSRIEFAALTPIINSYNDVKSINALKNAMYDVDAHFGWVQSVSVIANSAILTSMTSAESAFQSAVGVPPPIGASEVQSNLQNACSEFN